MHFRELAVARGYASCSTRATDLSFSLRAYSSLPSFLFFQLRLCQPEVDDKKQERLKIIQRVQDWIRELSGVWHAVSVLSFDLERDAALRLSYSLVFVPVFPAFTLRKAAVMGGRRMEVFGIQTCLHQLTNCWGRAGGYGLKIKWSFLGITFS